ncbi:4Fe-4S dicluster domain-containing protein [Nocardioides pacificus]
MTTQTASDLLAPLLRWLWLHPEPVDLHLVCPGWERSLPVGRHAVVVRTETCARGLPVSGYLELVLAGAAAVTLHPATCGCTGSDAESLHDAAGVLRAAGRTATLSEDSDPVPAPSSPRRRRLALRSPPLGVAELPMPRRALLTTAGVRSRVAAAARPASERDRLREALAELELPAWAAAELGLASEPPTSAVLTVEGCTACGVCVRGCPTGALSLSRLLGEDGASTRVLRQDVFACTGCDRCVELCPEDAMTRTGLHGWDALLNGAVPQLARCATRRCGRCRGAFVPTGDGDLCPVCAYRRERPFGTTSAPVRTDTSRKALT